MSDDLEWRSYADDTEATFNLYTPPPCLPRPDRAAALRNVETLMASVTNVDDRGMFFLADDERREFLTVSEFAALIVDRVLGAEQDGGAASP